MLGKARKWLWDKIVNWLLAEVKVQNYPVIDFDRMVSKIQPADVLLVEGRSRISAQIALITQSPWTHAALYIGRASDLPDDLKSKVCNAYDCVDTTPLLVEAELGLGTIVAPVSKYKDSHVRICRPHHLSGEDGQRVTRFAIERLGVPYNLRQILDLARFFYPYAIMPRRWRSTLFERNAGEPTKVVCSSMIARAFSSVKFPIVPTLRQDDRGDLRMLPRNHKLVTPKDFDYSPYFQVIKYPFLSIDDIDTYRDLPWDDSGRGRSKPTGEFDAIPSPSALDKPKRSK